MPVVVPETTVPVLNLREARFECIFGRGCEGICCREGRPPIYPDEIERLDANLEKIAPEMRAEACAVLKVKGYLSHRQTVGQRVLRVVNGWCIFFNRGCVLHRVGDAEGDKFRYKPAACSLFPLSKDEHDRWYVRQKGYDGEIWDLFCLDPAATETPAAESLREELAFAARLNSTSEKKTPTGD